MAEVQLERFKYAAMSQLPKNMLVEFSDSMMESFVRAIIAVRVTQKVYGHRLAEWDYAIEVPKNWWQHLKKNVGLRHKTVRTTGQVTRRRLYPDLPVLPADKAGVSYVVEDHVGY